jgi:hypothetical protein
VALERAKAEKEAHGEFESEHPDYRGAQDTFYVGNLKGVGRIYQQTFIDTYTKVAFAKLYDRKTPITAADLRNDRVVPFFDSQDVKLLRVLTDRGSKYCGNPERHEYEFYLGGGGHRPLTHQNEESADQRNLRTLPQDCTQRVLSCRILAKRCIVQSTSCRPISMSGSANTMRRGHIRDAGASAKRRCRPSWMQCQ